MVINRVTSRQSVFLLGFTAIILILYIFYSKDLFQQFYTQKFEKIRIFKIFLSVSTIKPLNIRHFVSNVSNYLTTNKYNSNNQSDKINEYFQIHQNIFSQKNTSLKKISFNGYTAGGYGNKLYSFITSLLIAILTDSQIVLKWNDIDKYIKPTINIFDNITENSGLNEIDFKNKSFYFSSTQAWSNTKNIDLLMETQVPSSGYLRYFYSSIDPFFMEICANPNYFKKFSYYNLVSNKTVNLALSVATHKNSTRLERQEKLFKVGFEIGGNLLNKIWHPNEAIMKQIDFFVNKYFKNNFVIGLQMRYGDGNPNQIYLNNDTDTIKFINCALEIEKENLLKNQTKNYKSFKWFIASDSPKNVDEIFRKYSNRTFTSNGTLSHVAYNSDGYFRTILDAELLSRCNELVVTGGSTFGWIAAMKMNKLPFFINGFSLMGKCLRANLSDRVPKTPSNYFVFK